MSARNAAQRDLAPPHTKPLSDAELLQRVAAGEIGALSELYDRHRESVRRFVARATRDAKDVDDLVHETFLAAAKSCARFDGRPSCRPWLLGIAAQLLRRRRQSFGRLLAVVSTLCRLRVAATDPRSALQASSDIARALSHLSEVKRVALLLAEVEGLSCAEIAATFKVPIGTVWTRLHAARREIRNALTEGGPS